MPTTTGGHPHTYPSEGATSWYSVWVTYAQAVSDDLDNIGTTIVAQINDSNSNEMLVFSTTASAVNHIQLANAATGSGPTFSAIGTDTNIDLNITPKGSGQVVLDGLKWPASDGTNGQVLQTDGSGNLTFASASGGLSDIVDDTTPQLGGNLDVNSNSIVSVSNGDITIEPNGTGSINLNAADVLVEEDIVHAGDTNNKIVFGTDTQDLQTGGSSRLDISDSGVRLGGANARVTTVLDEDNMASDSATSLATQQSIKAYVDSSGGGGRTLLTAGTVTSAADLVIDSTHITTTYDAYELVLSGLVAATDTAQPILRVSNDNGSSFRTSGYIGHHTLLFTGASGVAHTDGIRMSGTTTSGYGTGTGEEGSMTFIINNPTDASRRTSMTGVGGYKSAGTTFYGMFTSGQYDTAEDNDAIQLVFSTGNIANVDYILYGLTKS